MKNALGLVRTLAIAAVLAVSSGLAACTTEAGSKGTAASPDLVAVESAPPGEGSIAAGVVEQGSAAEGQSAGPATAQAQAAKPAATVMIPGQTLRLKPVSRIAASPSAEIAPRAGSAVYRCSGGGSIMVDNRRSLVVLRDPDGEMLELPASPAGQLTRYGKKPYALVLEGGEALFVKPRKPPFTCKR
ncbi:MAG TPA: hypothetical protein VIU14_00960 [Mesorhizobium sp.]